MRLTDGISQLTATLIYWDGLLVNPEYVHRGQTITWQTFERPMLPEDVTFTDVARLAEARNYSFQLLTDGSVFQVFYRYDRDGTTLLEATLAYYEGRSTREEGDFEPDEPMPPATRELARWLRIDYKSTDPRCALHNDCHMHVSGLPGARIPLDGVPTPKQFVDSVMAWCYPDGYADHCLEGGNRGQFREPKRQQWVHEQSFPFIDDDLFRQMVYMRLPRR